MKTYKVIAKRVKVTRTGKVLKRKGGQDHFNSRESGTVTRNKRRDQQLLGKHAKNIKALI